MKILWVICAGSVLRFDVKDLAIATRQKWSFDWRRFAWRKSVITTGKFSYDCSVAHPAHLNQ